MKLSCVQWNNSSSHTAADNSSITYNELCDADSYDAFLELLAKEKEDIAIFTFLQTRRKICGSLTRSLAHLLDHVSKKILQEEHEEMLRHTKEFQSRYRFAADELTDGDDRPGIPKSQRDDKETSKNGPNLSGSKRQRTNDMSGDSIVKDVYGSVGTTDCMYSTTLTASTMKRRASPTGKREERPGHFPSHSAGANT